VVLFEVDGVEDFDIIFMVLQELPGLDQDLPLRLLSTGYEDKISTFLCYGGNGALRNRHSQLKRILRSYSLT